MVAFARFSSCHDLLLSRFCAADYNEYNILGIKVHSITRLHNRTLRACFDDTLAEVLDEDESVYYQPGATRSVLLEAATLLCIKI